MGEGRHMGIWLLPIDIVLMDCLFSTWYRMRSPGRILCFRVLHDGIPMNEYSCWTDYETQELGIVRAHSMFRETWVFVAHENSFRRLKAGLFHTQVASPAVNFKDEALRLYLRCSGAYIVH